MTGYQHSSGCCIHLRQMGLGACIVFCSVRKLVCITPRAASYLLNPNVNWNNAKSNFSRHAAKSPVHSLAVTAYTSFCQNFVSKVSTCVNLQLDSLARKQVEANRAKLKIILQAVVFCAHQNISFRGHRDDSQHYDLEGNNPGNFQELLKLMLPIQRFIMYQ